MKYFLLLSAILALPFISAQDLGNVPFDPDAVIEENIEQPFMTGDIIASLYQTWTGKRVIVSKAAQGEQISFIQKGPLTYRQAADLLEKAILLEDLVFVPSGPNEVKLVQATQGRKVGGVPVIIQEFGLPDGEQLVTYVMTLNYISPEEALTILTSIISQISEKGSIVAVPNASALIITENSALIRTLINIKNRIDIPQERSTRQIATLSHADAEIVAEQVQKIIDFGNEQKSNFENNSNPPPENVDVRVDAPDAPDPAGIQLSSTPGRLVAKNSLSTLQVLAEPRTNRIFVMGRPIDVEFAMVLIDDFDQPLTKRNYYRQKLNFLPVADFLAVARDAIGLATSQIDSSQGASNSRGGLPQEQRSQGNRNDGPDDSGLSALPETNRAERPESILVGKTLLVADNASNSIIVQGPPRSIEVVRDLIEEMDREPAQVQITAVFGRYNLGDESQVGLDFAQFVRKKSDSGFAVQNRTGFPVLVDPNALTNLDAVDTLTGGIGGLSIYGQIGKFFLPTLRALQSSGRFHLLARPTVFTTNNRKAVLSSGQAIAVPTNTLTQGIGVGGNVAQSTNVSFRDVLLKLEVIPLVNSKDQVTLQIKLENDNIIGNQIIDGNEIPTIGKEALVTNVTIPSGDVIVLGGLITERDEDSTSGVPILSRIPGLGKLFSTERKNLVREELVIFIQPQIVEGQAALARLQDFNRGNSQLVRDVQDEQEYPGPQEIEEPSIWPTLKPVAEDHQKLLHRRRQGFRKR